MRVATIRETYTVVESYTDDRGNEREKEVPYTTALCARCHNRSTVHGHDRASFDAACCALRASCLKGETNLYKEP